MADFKASIPNIHTYAEDLETARRNRVASPPQPGAKAPVVAQPLVAQPTTRPPQGDLVIPDKIQKEIAAVSKQSVKEIRDASYEANIIKDTRRKQFSLWRELKKMISTPRSPKKTTPKSTAPSAAITTPVRPPQATATARQAIVEQVKARYRESDTIQNSPFTAPPNLLRTNTLHSPTWENNTVTETTTTAPVTDTLVPMVSTAAPVTSAPHVPLTLINQVIPAQKELAETIPKTVPVPAVPSVPPPVVFTETAKENLTSATKHSPSVIIPQVPIVSNNRDSSPFVPITPTIPATAITPTWSTDTVATAPIPVKEPIVTQLSAPFVSTDATPLTSSAEKTAIHPLTPDAVTPLTRQSDNQEQNTLPDSKPLPPQQLSPITVSTVNETSSQVVPQNISTTPRDTTFNRFFAPLIVGLFIISIGVFSIQFIPWPNGSGVTLAPENTITFNEATRVTLVPTLLTKDNIIEQIAGAKVTDATVTEIHLLTTFGGERINGTTIAELLGFNLSAQVKANISFITFGYYREEPWVTMTIANETTMRGGLLQWESTMLQDLSPLFTFTDTNQSAIFTDDIIGETDVRVIRSDTTEQIVYGFINPTTVLITTDMIRFQNLQDNIRQ